jgi:hypothetical protein
VEKALSKVMIKESVGIRREPEDVFKHVATDFVAARMSLHPEVKQIEQVSEGPLGAGTEFRERSLDATGLGYLLEVKHVVTTYDPPVRFVYRSESTFAQEGQPKPLRAADRERKSVLNCEYIVKSVGVHSCLIVSIDYEFQLSFASRIFMPLWLGAWRERTKRRLFELRDRLEQEAGLPRRRSVIIPRRTVRWLVFWLLMLVLFMIHQWREALGLDEEVAILLRTVLSALITGGIFLFMAMNFFFKRV